ncbi:c-type cytochrome [Pedobacter sp. MC2016-24]|uniref:c-type cytochrome n=1 Tax=Pedobacter sp. MC2016-24 TaxID=2780090 RepID=UPI00351C15DE
MNCQNCHLEAGTKPFALDFSVFISQYPKLNGRSGKVEPAHERINECMERSMNGKRLKPDGKEMKAILAYMAWVGADHADHKAGGQSVEKLPYMSRAADPLKGRMVYRSQCQNCHGENGQGLLAVNKKSYVYPPLWGNKSYNDAAGMYRLSNFAGFVKNNMPLGVTYKSPKLSDQEAWDVAAYVNSKPRGHRDQHNDYKEKDKKPIDFPFGPYQDAFSEQQHKFGPFAVIKSANKSHKKN